MGVLGKPKLKVALVIVQLEFDVTGNIAAGKGREHPMMRASVVRMPVSSLNFGFLAAGAEAADDKADASGAN